MVPIYKLVSERRVKNGAIVGYTLEGLNVVGTLEVNPATLKDRLHKKELLVLDLDLTKNDRLIKASPMHQALVTDMLQGRTSAALNVYTNKIVPQAKEKKDWDAHLVARVKTLQAQFPNFNPVQRIYMATTEQLCQFVFTVVATCFNGDISVEYVANQPRYNQWLTAAYQNWCAKQA